MSSAHSVYLFSPASSITAVAATRLCAFCDSGHGSEPELVTCAHFGWNFMANSTAISSLPAFRKVNKLVNGIKQYRAQLLYTMFNLGLCEILYIVLLSAKTSTLRKHGSIQKKVMWDMLRTKLNCGSASMSALASPRRLSIHRFSIFVFIYLSQFTYWPSLNKLQAIKELGHRILKQAI